MGNFGVFGENLDYTPYIIRQTMNQHSFLIILRRPDNYEVEFSYGKVS